MYMKFTFDNDKPIYIQLVNNLKMYIISGYLSPGDKIPSVRDIGVLAKINPNTVQKALLELENMKLIFTERTNGKYVTNDELLIQKYKNELASKKVDKFITDMNSIGYKNKEIIDLLKERK